MAAREVAYSKRLMNRLHRQLFQQRLRLFQIARIQPLGKPPVNWSQQFARLLHLALVAPEACEVDCGFLFGRFTGSLSEP
jgi:hypothetical protein